LKYVKDKGIIEYDEETGKLLNTKTKEEIKIIENEERN
jgi:hypothetical protein